MKRDMDLVRKILFAMEKPETRTIFDEINLVKIDGYKRDAILYHMKIMAQAGLLHIDLVETPRDPNVSVDIELPKIYQTYYSISWSGYEFLDVARNNKTWEKAKKALSPVGGFALDLMKQLLIQYLKTDLRLPKMIVRRLRCRNGNIFRLVLFLEE